MARVLYELLGRDGHRFSPYCWRIRMALAHKGLEADLKPVPFREKTAIAFAGHDKVPVFVDGARTVVESWDIAEYLEDTYADRPSLFGPGAGRSLARFVNGWADNVLQRAMIGLIVADICAHTDPADRDYFRQTRQGRFGGRKLEDVQAEARAGGAVEQFRNTLSPMRAALRAKPFLGGDAPLYPDYIALGAFQWARCVSAFPLLADDDPVAAWRTRMLGLFNGLAGGAPGYPC